MKILRTHAPDSATRRGRALVLLALLSALVLLAGGYWLGTMDQGDSEAPAIERPAQASASSEPEALVQAVDRETLATPEPAVEAPRADTPTPAEKPLAARELPQSEAARLLDAEGRMEKMRRLKRGEPEERLALAQEILAEDGTSTLVLHALQTMAELDPSAAAMEVKRRLEADDDPRSRGMMATVISMVGGNEAALSPTDLAEFYEIGDSGVQLAAARAMQARGDSSLTQRFQEERTQELSSEDPMERAEAVRQLGAMRQEDVMPLVSGMLNDPSPEVRMQALRTVGQSGGDQATLETVRGLTGDPDERVRRSAERMVESMERRLELRRIRR